ncbi:MAG: TonB-dependent receptor [Bacteroidaceae bacterium]|nr:TonB-dependent receptor [Bacteroidaceae bacterium]
MRFILTLLTVVASLSARTQTTISGTVTNLQHQPVGDVIVRVTDEKHTLAFCTTDAKGTYRLMVKDTPQGETFIRFAHISYEVEQEKVSLDGKPQVKDMLLVPKTITLKEVKVRAVPLTQMGDTLNHNLASFLGKGDVSLEDGLKRLPGVEVAKSGAISYMGKPISAFNIEGLNLLGGKYNLATRNIPADYVTQVQVIRNYHERKVDEDKPSDAVAMNIKLAKKAKMKPFGQEEAGFTPVPSSSGEGHDHWQGILGLTGMLFTEDFQTICSGKLGNYKDYANSDLTDHLGGSGLSTRATSLFGGFDGGRPPQGEYLYQRNAMGTVNGIQKVDSISTFRVNADYSYHRATHDIATATTYLSPLPTSPQENESHLDGASSPSLGTEGWSRVMVSEQTSPLSSSHLPSLQVNYRSNARQQYVWDMLTMKAKFEHNEGDVHYNNVWAEQRRKTTSLEVANSLNFSRRVGGHTVHFNSDVHFQRTPSLCLSFADSGEEWSQTAQSTSLTTEHRTSFDLHLTKKFTLNLPVSLTANYDFIETILCAATPSQQSQQQQQNFIETTLCAAIPSQQSPQQQDAHNRLQGTTFIPSFSPGFEWRNANRRLYTLLSFPFSFRLMHYGSTSLSKFYLNPSASLSYTFSANSKLSASSSLRYGTGDMLDLLTAPMQTSYRSTRTASGVIGESRNWASSLDWKLQVPLQYFTLNLGASHSEGKRNTLTSQSVSGVDVSTSSLFRDTHSRTTSFSLSSSKNIPSLFAKFGIKGNYSFGSGEQAVNGNVIQHHHQGYSLSGHVGITPVSWLEMNYDIDYNWQRSSYEDTRNTVTSLTHSGALHVFPISSLDISVNYDHVRRQITTDRYKHMSLFNASAQYKLKRLVLRLELDNLLNQRHYAYTVFDGINTYSYDYGLCGRTTFIKATFKL